VGHAAVVNRSPKPAKHGRDHGLGGEDPAPHWAYYCIKVTADANALDGLLPDEATIPTVGDGRFIFEIDEDLEVFDRLPADREGLELKYVRAYVTTAGGVTVQLRKIRAGSGDVDMLTTKVTVDSGEKSSSTAATPYVINTANAEVFDGDQIAIDIDAVSGSPKGLGVNLGFGPQ
jgi:hypothetical protein